MIADYTFTPLINLYHQAEDYFFRGISSKCLALGDGINAYMTGVPVADLNLVYVTKNTNALEKILNQSKQFYDQANLPFVVIIPEEFCSSEMKSILNARGYSQTGKSVSMAVKLDAFTAQSATRFDDTTIIQVNANQLNDWRLPLIGAFESTIEISSVYAATHRAALKKNINLRHFSLYKQEKPIASITLSIHDSITRCDDVGTLPEFQNRGYATHLITYTLLEAKKLGAHYCFLESSASGFGIYQKLGFEPLFKNNIYSLPPH